MTSPQPGGDAQAEAMSSMMMPMLLLLGMMVLLMVNPSIRVALSYSAGTVIEPVLPFHQRYFVPTVFIVGSSIMVVNTVIRSFFMDPLQQAHFSHRSRQIGKQLREARLARDTATADKMQNMQFEMMPEQMKMQSSMMKPMVFTMVFIIAIFSWMAESVESFRVGFVSLPWNPMWSFNDRILWIFPAWIATYIAMSAPLGRIIDRHIKIARYSRHPLVLSREKIDEPLLHMLEDDNKRRSSSSVVRRSQRRAGPRKTGNKYKNPTGRKSGNQHAAPPKEGMKCNMCDSDQISRTPRGLLRCDVCRSEWR
ncbi:MAG: hypothetical protein CMB67_02120 [Euryarchaeota archaeon]|nr:hypothetical protein [Euryarchaeota archaeon]|tara:strand:- start:306 stop:1232 length:927 start_codon:yes stop_codon:yes gene_type:complete